MCELEHYPIGNEVFTVCILLTLGSLLAFINLSEKLHHQISLSISPQHQLRPECRVAQWKFSSTNRVSSTITYKIQINQLLLKRNRQCANQ